MAIVNFSILLIAFSVALFYQSLSLHTSQSKDILYEPFRTVRFMDDNIFFTLNSGRAFGYINISSRGEPEVIYQLEDD